MRLTSPVKGHYSDLCVKSEKPWNTVRLQPAFAWSSCLYPESLRIGIHTSTAGSLEKAAIKANELGANTFQIFSASPRMWRARTPDPERIKLLNDCRAKYDLTPLVTHVECCYCRHFHSSS
jgi:hypothetical protein